MSGLCADGPVYESEPIINPSFFGREKPYRYSHLTNIEVLRNFSPHHFIFHFHCRYIPFQLTSLLVFLVGLDSISLTSFLFNLLKS